MKTTPDQVRKELKNHRLPFEIQKTNSCWYVYGEECTLWYTQSLHTYKVSGLSAAKWVEMIVDMAIDNRPRVLNGLQTIKDPVWKAGVEACIKAVDDYKAWQETVAKKKSEKE
jgi:hypothetical protein